MKKENISPKIKTNLDTKSDQYRVNKEMMLEKLDFLDGLLDIAEIGGVCIITIDWLSEERCQLEKEF